MAKLKKAEIEALEVKISLYEQAEKFLEERDCILPVKTYYNPRTLLSFIKEQLSEMRAQVAPIQIS